MAYSILKDDILELTFVGEIFLQRTMTVLHYVVDTAPPVNDAWTQLNDFLVDIQGAALWTNYKNCIATTWASTELRAQIVSPVRRPVVVRAVTDNGSGTGPTTLTNISGVITKRTDVITHRAAPLHMGGVGSIHLPCPPIANVDQGKLVILQQNNMADLIPDILLTRNIGTTGAVIPCIWHRNPLAAIRYDVLQQCEVQDTVRTMRRRTLALGI